MVFQCPFEYFASVGKPHKTSLHSWMVPIPPTEPCRTSRKSIKSERPFATRSKDDVVVMAPFLWCEGFQNGTGMDWFILVQTSKLDMAMEQYLSFPYFQGMSTHLPAILVVTRVPRVWTIHIQGWVHGYPTELHPNISDSMCRSEMDYSNSNTGSCCGVGSQALTFISQK